MFRGARMASVVVLTYPDRAGAEELTGILRALGVAAAAMPGEGGRVAGSMVWEVRVSEPQAVHVKALLEAVRGS